LRAIVGVNQPGNEVKIPESVMPSLRWQRIATGNSIAMSFRMTRVLIVEDSPDILCILQLELEWLGYEIDGFEFIKRVRAIPALASVPAIALTGTSLERDVQQALAFGFTAHVVKPVEMADLAQKINQLTSRRLKRKAG
jgi:CheY-like chemotaxis protein